MGFPVSILSSISSPKVESVIAVTSTRTSISVNGPKKTIEIHNPSSGSTVYYGDSTVLDTTGIPIVPGETKVFSAVENGFILYLVCAAAQTSNCRYISYRGR